MRMKAIALDMDGTLLNSKNEIDEAGIELLKGLHEQGICIFLSTGRTKREVFDVLPENFLVDGMVTSNGAGCYTNDHTLLEASIEFEQVKRVIIAARNYEMYYEIHPFVGARMAYKRDRKNFEKIAYFDSDFAVPEHEINSCKQAIESKINWISSLPEIPIVKVYFFHKNKKKVGKFTNELKLLEDEGEFTASSSTEHNVEIVSEGATKATGLELFLKRFDLSPEELIAFGDGENDLPMFELAKHAVAMKNAPDFVKRKADDVTDYTNEEHGVFHYINEHKEFFDLE